MNRSNWKTDAGLLFAVLVWGFNFPILKSALSVMPLFVVNAFRFTVSALVLGGVYLVDKCRRGERFSDTIRLHGPQIVGLGFLGYVLYQLSFIFGLDFTKAGSAALIMASSPLWTAVIGHGLGIEHVTRGAWGGLALGLVGTAAVIFFGSQDIDFTSTAFLGNLLMLAAAGMWGAYTALSRPVLRTLPPASLAFLGLVVGLPVLLGLSIPYFDEVDWSRIDAWVWLAILFSGGLSTGLTVVIWNEGIKRVGAAQTSAYSNLVPFVGVLASLFIRGEGVTIEQILGGMLIIGGLLLTRRARKGGTAPAISPGLGAGTTAQP